MDEAQALPVGGAVGVPGGRRNVHSALTIKRRVAKHLVEALELQGDIAKGRPVRVKWVGDDGVERERVLKPTVADTTRAAKVLLDVTVRAALTSGELRRRMGRQVRAISQWAQDWGVPQAQVEDLLTRIQEAWA